MTNSASAASRSARMTWRCAMIGPSGPASTSNCGLRNHRRATVEVEARTLGGSSTVLKGGCATYWAADRGGFAAPRPAYHHKVIQSGDLAMALLTYLVTDVVALAIVVAVAALFYWSEKSGNV